jgi:hypothetical protein
LSLLKQALETRRKRLGESSYETVGCMNNWTLAKKPGLSRVSLNRTSKHEVPPA